MSNIELFKNYLKETFNIDLNNEFLFIEFQNVIRVYSKTLQTLKPKGWAGFVAGRVKNNSIDIKTEFIQLVGSKATKNILYVNENQAKDLIHNNYIEINHPDGLKIIKYGRHVIGIGIIKNNKLTLEFINKGRKRVVNTIKP